MYEVHLNPLDSKYVKFKVNGLRNFHLQDSDDVCNLIKKLPENVLVSLKDYEFDTPESIIDELLGSI